MRKSESESQLELSETVSWWWLSKKVRFIDDPFINYTPKTLKDYAILPYKKEKVSKRTKEK